MDERIQINDDVTVGAQPSRKQLGALPAEGFRSVMNLRTADEEDQPLSPEEEGELVRDMGLEYRHVPISAEDMDQDLVNRFREELDEIPKPVFVHCRRGKRSGAMAMMDEAVSRGMSGEETLQKAEEMGFECDVEELNNFVRTYVDEHSGAVQTFESQSAFGGA